jgi:hypothetical protein
LIQPHPLIPAKAGIQGSFLGVLRLWALGPRLRGDERNIAAGVSRLKIRFIGLQDRPDIVAEIIDIVLGADHFGTSSG